MGWLPLQIRKHLFSLLAALSIGPYRLVLLRKTQVYRSSGAFRGAPALLVQVRDRQAPDPAWRPAAAMLLT